MNTKVEAVDVRQHLLETGQRIMSGKGFSAVGLNEILATAGVPKGSFYHYFSSKDAFGEALLEGYFEDNLSALDEILARADLKYAERLMSYWKHWRHTQGTGDPDGKCLAVKLGAEVADLSEPMRGALDRGTAQIILRLAGAIQGGQSDGSLERDDDPAALARTLYQMWLGASVMAKITRDDAPFDAALATTTRILHLGRA